MEATAEAGVERAAVVAQAVIRADTLGATAEEMAAARDLVAMAMAQAHSVVTVTSMRPGESVNCRAWVNA